MRDANVLGTNEVLRLAFEGQPKRLNYVSTTFVFGWAVKKVLSETDFNENNADFPACSREPLRYRRRQQFRYSRSLGCVHGEPRHRS
jgi:thioester reductase-like protein